MKKSTVVKALDLFDDEFTAERFIERLLFIEKVEKGLEDIEMGKTHDYSAVRHRFNDQSLK